jgi:hypothetical protein
VKQSQSTLFIRQGMKNTLEDAYPQAEDLLMLRQQVI